MQYLDRLFFKYTKDSLHEYRGNTILGDLVGAGIFIGGCTLFVIAFEFLTGIRLL